MSLNCFIYTLASVAVVSSYPIFRQQGRFEPQEINLPLDFAQSEPAPMYGYPDFGDYTDSRPAYSELDIVREQLAHPQIPLFIKRFPANIPYPYGEPIALDDAEEEEQNWRENDVSINKPALEMLTEALMETLIRKSESNSNLQPEDGDFENDHIVQELKETGAKKSSPPQPTAKTFENSKNKTPQGSAGQQEIALLRPPSHSPILSVEPTNDVKAAPVTTQQEFIVDPYSNEEYIMSIVTAWLIIRGLSFALHRCRESRKSKTLQQDLSHYLGFCFYFPLLFTGPLMMFNDFEKQLLAPKPKWDIRRLLFNTLNILRYIFWFLFNELTLHYFYVHTFRLYVNLLTHCPRLVLNGVGYSVSQFFMNKYTVLYGLPGAIAQLEHYDPPPKPKCVARIYMYSDMWRYFDRGLYTFFTNYIYVPVLGVNSSTFKKLIGTILCFTFVFLWHGATYTNFVWALLNYVEVTLEMITSAITRNNHVIKFEERWISPTWSRRLHGLFAVPLLYLGCVSNFYFLVGHEATDIMIDSAN
uniref:Uncharacterized protein n=1 Tax=Strigamia maritima TaxID=126957 RepID=T1IPU2_STRMM